MSKKDPHFTFPKGLIKDLTPQEKMVQEAIEKHLAPYNTTTPIASHLPTPPGQWVSVTTFPNSIIPYLPRNAAYFKTDND